MPEATPQPWWSPERHRDRRARLILRGQLKRAISEYFEDQDYIEVETSALQLSPGNETHLHAFQTSFDAVPGAGEPLYLHTSPEFACKKLLAAGETKVFTFARCYRNRELGDLHEPEFTMLEWYEAGADYTRLMDQCADILALAADTAGNRHWSFRGHKADAHAAPERIAVADALAKAGIDILATLPPEGPPNRDALAQAASSAGVRIADDDTWSDIFTRVLLEKVEPVIGQGRPAILDRYPLPEAALARPAPDDPRVAERFELYCCGVELANAFGELTDANAQRRRFEADMAEKQRLYGETYPIDEDFLSALAHMPPASGCALGFDRLVMLAAGAQRVADVIWTPVSAILPRGTNG